MDKPRHKRTRQALMRERISRLGDDLNNLSSAIREELDWREKLYPVSADDDEDVGQATH